jgi:hypothetical protein
MPQVNAIRMRSRPIQADAVGEFALSAADVLGAQWLESRDFNPHAHCAVRSARRFMEQEEFCKRLRSSRKSLMTGQANPVQVGPSTR